MYTYIIASLARSRQVHKELDEGIDSHQLMEDWSGTRTVDSLRHVRERTYLLQQDRVTGLLW